MWDILRQHWVMIWSLLTFVISLILMLLSKTYARRDALEKIELRVNAMEQAISSLPSREDLHKLQLEMRDLRGELRELAPSIRQVSRISDLLLENELKDRN